jgi:hypothetical protein
VKKWINFSRKFDSPPDIQNDLPAYVKAWHAWWRELQPKSHLTQQGTELLQQVGAGETWVELRKGSQNGFYMVVLTLSWWKKAAITSPQQKAFSAALEDALWAVDQMLRIGKRPGDDLPAPASKRVKVA